MSEKTGAAYRAMSVGSVLPVLFETEEDGESTGHSDTYLRVKVSAPSLRGTLHDVRVRAAEDDLLLAELLS